MFGIKSKTLSVLAGLAMVFSVSSAQAGGSLKDPYPSIWQGFYFGGHIGGVTRDEALLDALGLDGAEGGSVIINNEVRVDVDVDDDASGFAGGIHAGYNFQKGNLVYGIEGDITWTDSEESIGVAITDLEDDVTVNGSLSLNMNYLASLRGRLGYATNTTLVYVTGGIAWTELELEASLGASAGDIAVGISDSESETFTGYVIGGGAEYKFTDNLSMRGEVLHYGFDDDGVEFDATSFRAGLSWHSKLIIILDI